MSSASDNVLPISPSAVMVTPVADFRGAILVTLSQRVSSFRYTMPVCCQNWQKIGCSCKS